MKKRIVDTLCLCLGIPSYSWFYNIALGRESHIDEVNANLRQSLNAKEQEAQRLREALEQIASRHHRGLSRVGIAKKALGE